MHRVETYKRNSKEKFHLFPHVFATDREIFKGKFFAKVIYCSINNEIEWNNVLAYVVQLQ